MSNNVAEKWEIKAGTFFEKIRASLDMGESIKTYFLVLEDITPDKDNISVLCLDYYETTSSSPAEYSRKRSRGEKAERPYTYRTNGYQKNVSVDSLVNSNEIRLLSGLEALTPVFAVLGDLGDPKIKTLAENYLKDALQNPR